MTSKLSRITLFGVLFIGLIYTIWYSRKGTDLSEESLITSMHENKGLKDQLQASIEQLNKDMASIRKAGGNDHVAMTDSKLDKLNQEVANLRSKLDALSNDSHEPPKDYLVAEEEKEQQTQQQMQQIMTLYQGTAEREGVDQKWASEAQEKINESFLKVADNGIFVENIKCHSTFCQAHFNFDPDADLQAAQQISPWQSEVLLWVDNLERGKGVVFLAREGEKLPDNR